MIIKYVFYIKIHIKSIIIFFIMLDKRLLVKKSYDWCFIKNECNNNLF